MIQTSEKFNEKRIFTYNHYKKLGIAIAIYSVIIIGVLFAAGYFFFLKTSNFFLVRGINSIFANVAGNIAKFSVLGGLYASFFGGLFFVPLPIEVVFIGFLKAGQNVALMTLIFLLGVVLSYWFNYQVGFWLSGTSKKIIGAKTFYKIKLMFNKYGPWGIFLFNVSPLPSQPLSTILGVFNYNRKKFWFYTMLGEVIKFVAMAIGYFYIT
jgi:membrane protein YqaA with SNARE-associated domain